MERDPTVDWAYASFFGTGWYKLDSERSAFVIRATPRWSLREATIDEDGNRQIGYRLRLPLTLGLNRFDVEDLPGLVDLDNFGTIGVNVGFDIDIPVSRQFSLRPNVEAGYGTVLNDSARSWVYRADIRGRYRFQPDDLAWTLNAAVGAAGHSPNTGNSQSFNYVAVAAERGHGTPWKNACGRADQPALATGLHRFSWQPRSRPPARERDFRGQVMATLGRYRESRPTHPPVAAEI